jgi:hypothetical protein
MRATFLLLFILFPFRTASTQVQPEALLPLNPPLNYEESSQGLGYPQLDGGPIGVEMGDVNGDGFVDILSIGDHGSPYINTQEHGIMVWFGNGSGTNWVNYMTGDFGYGGIALGDVNNDGFVDVGYGMHHNYAGGDFGDQLLEVALGDGTGQNWTPWDDHLAEEGQSWGMFDTDFADVDTDGDLDVVSTSFGSGDGLHAYLNNGDGTWTHSFGELGGNSDCFLTFGDVNGDGYPDFAAGHQQGTVFLGDGTGNFVKGDANLPSPGAWGHYYGVDLGDVDGDGCQDLSYCTSKGKVSVWLWSADNRWHEFSNGLPLSGNDLFTQLCDMDGDGRMDLVTFGKAMGRVWRTDPAGTWQEAASFKTGNPGYVEVLRTGFDVDFNGRPDIALVSDEGVNRLRFFRESSTLLWPRVRLAFPRGGETFIRGAVVFVDWVTALPRGAGGESKIDLKLSTDGPAGPWSDMASDLPNNGRFQWSIPAGLPASADCRIRIKVTWPTGGASYMSKKSFRLD